MFKQTKKLYDGPGLHARQEALRKELARKMNPFVPDPDFKEKQRAKHEADVAKGGRQFFVLMTIVLGLIFFVNWFTK